MSNNPYAAFGSPRGLDELPPPPQRLSVLAVFSLILSLLCLTAPLGLICGGIALIVISRSRGRLSGTGLAAIGTIIGLILSVVMLLVVIGMAQFSASFGSNFTAPVGSAMAAVEKDDVPGVQALFSTSAAPAVTSETITDFRVAYQAELGQFTGVPSSMLDYITAFGKIGPLMQKVGQAAPQGIPFAGYFQNGTAALVLEVAPGASQPVAQGKWVPQAENLGIVTPKGTVIWLIPRAVSLPPAALPPAVPPPSPAAPAPAPNEEPAPAPEPAPEAPR